MGDNMESPTLRKVREVYHRRNIEDKRIIDERREAMARRVALNEFKAKEQQRETQLKAMKEKEMHKVRMLAAEERKMMADAFEEDRLQKLGEKQEEHVAKGCLKAAMSVEKKRQDAADSLDAWHTNMLLCEDRVRKNDKKKLARSEEKWNAYVQTLWRIGVEKHSEIMSQQEENDLLRKKVQSSIKHKLASERQRESDALRRHVEEKQAAAAYRRESGLQSRYNFLEKAFGQQSLGFDCKHHAGNEVDRRSDAWKKNAESWNRLKASFDDPVMSKTI